MLEWCWVVAAAFVAGMVDAMVGGGGLLTVPALFSAFPTTAPVLLLGTNKCSSLLGTSVAAWRYGRNVALDWRWLLPATGIAFLGACVGAASVGLVPAVGMRLLLPVLLTVVWWVVLRSPQLGLTAAPPHRLKQSGLFTPMLLAALMGWYDGFFGPGTGSFLIFWLVRGMGLDFLQASASAKVINVTTNLAALGWMALHGQVWWQVGLYMAVANIAGSWLGTALALKHGARLVRVFFLGVVALLILKTGSDAYVDVFTSTH